MNTIINTIEDPKHAGYKLTKNSRGQVCRIHPDGRAIPVNSSEIDLWMGERGYKDLLEGQWERIPTHKTMACPFTLQELGYGI